MIPCHLVFFFFPTYTEKTILIFRSAHDILLSKKKSRGDSAMTEKEKCFAGKLYDPFCEGMPGVTIGSGSVIGAGAVVSKSIPENSLAYGVPCRVIREITDEDSLKNKPELF